MNLVVGYCYIIDQLNHIREEKCKTKTRHGRLRSEKREINVHDSYKEQYY